MPKNLAANEQGNVADKPAAVTGFGALVTADSKRNATSGQSKGSGKVSANASRVLAKLRELGTRLQGMTAEELRHALQLSQNSTQTRKAIRQAQEAALVAGDLLYCRHVFTSVDSRGEEIHLNNGVSRYYIVPSVLAETATEEQLATVKAEATDFVYKGIVSPETRSKLAIQAREVFLARGITIVD